MSMTKREYLGKQEVHRILAEQGYPTYAHLFDMFDLHLTNDPNVIGYMIPSKAVITVNENLDLEQVSVIVRHEILHEYLNHAARMEKHTGTKNLSSAQHQDFNIAGDYEISNLGYTENDKKNIRHIVINGVKLSGLVTEDDHPDWVGLSVEEMYDKLEEERAKSNKEMENDLKDGTQESDKENQQIVDGGPGMPPQPNQPQNGDGQPGDSNGQQTGGDSQPNNNNQNGNGQTSGDGTPDGKKGDGTANTPHKPQIGDRGDPDSEIQKAEDIYRKAHEYKADAENDAKDAVNDGDLDKAKDNQKLADKADDLADKAKDIHNQLNNTDGENNDKELARRIKEIQDAFKDLQQQKNIIDETERKVFKDRQERRSKEQKKREHQPVSSGDINAFRRSIEKFMRDTLSDSRDYTWRRFNKNLVGTGLIGKGKAVTHNQKIPTLAVYFDQSGSWSEKDVARGFNAISALNEYVKRGQLKINIYYFAVNIHTTPEAARAEGGTCKADLLLDHIAATKPNNVVIMTDGDVDSSNNSNYVTVNGGVWLLFRTEAYMSKDLPQRLHGKKLNRIFII